MLAIFVLTLFWTLVISAAILVAAYVLMLCEVAHVNSSPERCSGIKYYSEAPGKRPETLQCILEEKHIGACMTLRDYMQERKL